MHSFISRVTPTLGNVDKEHLKKQIHKIKPKEAAAGRDKITVRNINMVSNSMAEGLQGMFRRVIYKKQPPCNWNMQN